MFSDRILILSKALIDEARAKKLTIATAESCTGGLIAAALTEIPGASDVVECGFVVYSNKSKAKATPATAESRRFLNAKSIRKWISEPRALSLFFESRRRSRFLVCRIFCGEPRPDGFAVLVKNCAPPRAGNFAGKCSGAKGTKRQRVSRRLNGPSTWRASMMRAARSSRTRLT